MLRRFTGSPFNSGEMNINFKKLRDGAYSPLRATSVSAGADLFACLEKELVLSRGSRMLIPTGIAAEIPAGYGGFVYPRSSLASRYGVTLSNCVGLIDADYRGEIMIPLINLSEENYTIHPGDRIAQLVIMPVELPIFIEKDELSESERGDGGFGSTGK
jgi:dUTP pyrophosphatase